MSKPRRDTERGGTQREEGRRERRDTERGRTQREEKKILGPTSSFREPPPDLLVLQRKPSPEKSAPIPIQGDKPSPGYLSAFVSERA